MAKVIGDVFTSSILPTENVVTNFLSNGCRYCGNSSDRGIFCNWCDRGVSFWSFCLPLHFNSSSLCLALIY